MGLVEIQNASDCVVRLANPKTAHFSVLRLNNVDPGSLTVQGKRRDRFISFSGPGVIIEVHSPDSGLFAASRTVQITVGDWEADRRAFEHLYAEFCSGRSPSGSDAVS